MTTKVHVWGVWVRERGHDHQGTHVGVWVREGGHDHQGTLTASLTLLWPTMMTTGGSPMAAHKE